MSVRFFFLVFATCVSILSGFGQQQQNSVSKLVSGPMLGYRAHFEVLIWMEVSTAAENVAIKYAPSGTPEDQKTAKYQGVLHQPFNPLKFVINGLEVGTTYQYEVWIDGVRQKFDYPLEFTTRELWEWRKDAPDFSFIIGSCSYINDPPYDRPGDPYGQDISIFKSITAQPGDFMIWGGDNVYLREVDWSSAYGINYRYHHVRKLKVLQPLLASRSHFAIWDDHDYGPNNSDQSYELRHESLQTFKDYWGNQHFGGHDNPGVYSRFTWSDAEFFLLDDRFHRSNEDIDDSDPQKSYLGRAQLSWLKNSLLSSNARFKFIISGNQVLNPVNTHECFRHYQSEFLELMNFIVTNEIWGVLFLSGDRHFTEMNQLENPGFYTFYDITSSPLTSRPYAGIKESKEGDNPARVKGTLVNQQNFVKVSALGSRKERQLLIECFDKQNQKLWEKTIHKNDLRPPKKDKK